MKSSVWKFPFKIEDEFVLEMPRHAKLLHVAMQGSRFADGKACIWALVDDEAPSVMRKFALRITGQDCDDLRGAEFVGSFFGFQDGSAIYHVFDRG